MCCERLCRVFADNLEELPALRICSSETPLRGQYCGRFSNSRQLGDIDVDAPRLVARQQICGG
jgi:hypothetical protein